MRRGSGLLTACLLLLPRVLAAQPALDTLWPNADGIHWTYRIDATDVVDPGGNFTAEAVLWFDGEVPTAGGPAQMLHGTHPVPTGKPGHFSRDPLLAQLWKARPDLRPLLAARGSDGSAGDGTGWWPLLLHDGYFMKSASNIQMWQPGFDHPTWTYLTGNLNPGAQFTQQLIPEFADNVFLHGTVEAVDATVQTDAGTFHGAVRMGYVVDYGWTAWTDDAGNPHGLYRSETRGHVHFVPGAGPVELLEEMLQVAEFQCDDNGCPPPSITDLVGDVQVSLRLSLTRSTVGVQHRTWSEVKSLYHD